MLLVCSRCVVGLFPVPMIKRTGAPGGHAAMVFRSTLEATQGQIDGFFSQLPYKCHQNRVASVGD